MAACNQKNARETVDLDFLTITGNYTYIVPLALFFFIKVIEEEQNISLVDKPFPALLHSAGYRGE